MIVDGKKIAERMYARIRDEVLALGRSPHLTIITCAPNPETQRYLALKRRNAALINIETNIIELPPTASTDDIVKVIQDSLTATDGVILQLPLPLSIDVERVLRAIPSAYDVDALNPETTAVFSPVVGACIEILTTYNISVDGARAVVIGEGRLVGRPVAAWLKNAGARVTVVKKDDDIADALKDAEIIVCGAGDPGIVTPEMIKDGVVILDAGASESGGMLRGDADPACGKKAKLFTPVPGGIGPVTVAYLYKNLLLLARTK